MLRSVAQLINAYTDRERTKFETISSNLIKKYLTALRSQDHAAIAAKVAIFVSSFCLYSFASLLLLLMYLPMRIKFQSGLFFGQCPRFCWMYWKLGEILTNF